MVKQNIWNEFGEKSKNADIAITIGIGFKLLLLMSAYTRKKPKKQKPRTSLTYDEGLTVLRELQQQGAISPNQVFLRCVYFPPVR